MSGAETGSLWSPPQGKGWTSLEEMLDRPDIHVLGGWGPEGTGKTMWFLRFMPLPIMMLNLDRPVTKAHMGWPGMKERVGGIFVQNLRENFEEELDSASAVELKDRIESYVKNNLAWLKGGTVMIDGATTLRDILKLADPKIGAAMTAGKRWNPKEKASVNSYLASFIGNIQDKGINLVFTGHSANSWKMVATRTDEGEMKNTLTRTNNLYPKMDDIIFERATVSMLFFKRCECGRNIVDQDGTCAAQPEATSDKAGMLTGHIGRKHMIRFVTHKLNTAVEGSEWEDLDGKTFDILASNPKAAKALMDSED